MARLRTDSFGFRLPPELIAAYPPKIRGESRLLVLRRATGQVEHRQFADLPSLLSPGDLLVLNKTRVRPSIMTTVDGALEILLMDESSPRHWVVLVKPGKKAKPGARLVFPGPAGAPPLEAEVLTTLPGGERVLRFFADFKPADVAAMPLPPYIRARRREMGQPEQVTDGGSLDDRERYQTVFAEKEGSVAAPTAGLHFTPEMLEKIPHAAVELQVGLGTFRPVKCEYVEDHEMHEELFRIPEGFAEKAAAATRLVAVGTTAARVLETVKDLNPQGGRTKIFIYPPRQLQRVGAMITNFHLPQSTLLMMICAFAGTEQVLAAYEEAVKEKYRFYSYGDAMAIL